MIYYSIFLIEVLALYIIYLMLGIILRCSFIINHTGFTVSLIFCVKRDIINSFICIKIKMRTCWIHYRVLREL